MASSEHPKVGFVGWNPFQFLHFEKVAARIPGATFILEERNRAEKIFDFESLLNSPHQVLRRKRSEMRALDGMFDVLVCQTQFEGIEEIRQSRIAMLQYGYAKESHNFAPWRSFADVCMTFGEYASRNISRYCHCVATGNPRYEDWESPSFHQNAGHLYAGRLDPRKQTILYAPTWGGHSSYHHFAKAISALAGEFNVIIKIHHNSQRAGTRFLHAVRNRFPVVCDSKDDIVALLAVSDVLISDYSGALFDAIFCKVPVVLLHAPAEEKSAATAADRHSLERAKSRDLGEVVTSPSQLKAAVHRALDDHDSRFPSLAAIRDDLFVNPANASLHAGEVLRDLANGKFQPTEAHDDVRRQMRASYRRRNRFPVLRRIKNLLAKGAAVFRRDARP